MFISQRIIEFAKVVIQAFIGSLDSSLLSSIDFIFIYINLDLVTFEILHLNVFLVDFGSSQYDEIGGELCNQSLCFRYRSRW